MPSLSKKDRVSLCLFAFSDGRRCRTPRIATHPHFCLYHAQKEAQSLATQKLGERTGLLLLRQLPRRLRSQHRPVPHHPRRRPRRHQTQNRPHRRLPRANPPAVDPRSPARIHQRLSTDFWRDAVQDSVKPRPRLLFPPEPAPAPKPASQPSAPPPQTQPQRPASAPASNPPQPASRPAPAPITHEPRSAAAPKTGPSGLPLLATLPPPKPGPPLSSGSS